MNYAERIIDIKAAAEKMGKPVYHEVKGQKDITPRTDQQNNKTKLCTLEEAIRRSGLKDGMTISFHHHFPSFAIHICLLFVMSR